MWQLRKDAEAQAEAAVHAGAAAVSGQMSDQGIHPEIKCYDLLSCRTTRKRHAKE